MYTWHEVLKADTVKDSKGTIYPIGANLILDETREAELLDTIENYENDDSIRSVQGQILPRQFKEVKPKDLPPQP